MAQYLLEDYQALGTTWYVEVLDRNFSSIHQISFKKIQTRLVAEIEAFQKKFSRFEESSLLNELNRNKTVQFDQDLFVMLELAESMRIRSFGVFDIAIKELLENIGYGKKARQKSPPTISSLSTNPELRYQKIGQTIVWNHSQEIDLGGIGKGYLIDLLVKLLKFEYDLEYFLISGGGDIYVTSNQGKSVALLLEHPTQNGMYIGQIEIKDASLCCSSSFKRVWEYEGQSHNHLIDVQTTSSSNALVASYVIADTATEADMLATTLCLLSEKPREVDKLTKNKDIDYLLVTDDQVIASTPIFKTALSAL